VCAYKSFASEHLTHKIENQNPFQVLPKIGQKKVLQLLANNICAHSVKTCALRKKKLMGVNGMVFPNFKSV